jgi:hypothetical protein
MGTAIKKPASIHDSERLSIAELASAGRISQLKIHPVHKGTLNFSGANFRKLHNFRRRTNGRKPSSAWLTGTRSLGGPMPIRHAEWRVRSNQAIKFSS